MARQYTDIDDYMPEMKDDKLPNRDYVSNVGKLLQDFILSEHPNPRTTARHDWQRDAVQGGSIYQEAQPKHEGSAWIQGNVHENQWSV